MKKMFLIILVLAVLLSGCTAGEINRPVTAEEYIDSMTLSEKVAQMFIVHCPTSGAQEMAEKHQFGGYLLFANHFKDESPESIKEKIALYQKASKTPMFIAVDEEGGIVTRVSRYPSFRSTRFASPQDLYNEGGIDKIASDTDEKSKLLLSLGINVNFAPVCDVATSPDAFIYSRVCVCVRYSLGTGQFLL